MKTFREAARQVAGRCFHEEDEATYEQDMARARAMIARLKQHFDGLGLFTELSGQGDVLLTWPSQEDAELNVDAFSFSVADEDGYPQISFNEQDLIDLDRFGEWWANTFAHFFARWEEEAPTRRKWAQDEHDKAAERDADLQAEKQARKARSDAILGRIGTPTFERRFGMGISITEGCEAAGARSTHVFEDEQRKAKVVGAIERLIQARARGSLEGVLRELVSLSGGRRDEKDKPSIPNYYLRDLEANPLYKLTDAAYRAIHGSGKDGKEALEAGKSLLDQLEKAFRKRKAESVDRRFAMDITITEEGLLGRLGRWAMSAMIPFKGKEWAGRDYVASEVIPTFQKAWQATEELGRVLAEFKAEHPEVKTDTPIDDMLGEPLEQALKTFIKDFEPRKMKEALEGFFKKWGSNVKLEKSPFPLRTIISRYWGQLLKDLALVWEASTDFGAGHAVDMGALAERAVLIHKQINRLVTVFSQIEQGTA